MDGCYVPNNPAYTDCWRPVSPTTCGHSTPVLTPLRPLAASSPPPDPPPAYPPARTPLPPVISAAGTTAEPADSTVVYPTSTRTPLDHATADQVVFSVPARTPSVPVDPDQPTYITSTTPSFSQGLISTTTPTSSMGAFPPLFDLEPLPNFVTLSPHAPYKDVAMLGKEKGDHMADVLLSLKHAVVHPHQVGESPVPPPTPPPPPPPPPPPGLPPFHPPPSYSPYPSYLSSFTSLAPLASLGPPMPPSLTPGGSSLLTSGHDIPPPSMSPPADLPPPPLPPPPAPSSAPLEPPGFHDPLATTPPPPASSPSSSSTSMPLVSGSFSVGASSTGGSFGTFSGSFGPIGGPLPPMMPSGYSSPVGGSLGSSLNGGVGGSLASVAPPLSPYPYQQSQTLPSMMGGVGAGAGYGAPSYQDAYSSSSHMFPAMSVNVSMNMTMGVANMNMGYTPDPPLQHQWSSSCGTPQVPPVSPVSGVAYPQHSTPSLVSPIHMTYSSGCSQSYSSGSYAWAGDLRGDPTSIAPLDRDLYLKSPPLRPRPSSPSTPYIGSSAAVPTTQTSPALAALRRRPGMVGMPGMSCSGALDSKPPLLPEGLKTNLCRICGKTYARPSTLKTHLRTHSGEKPYRCSDCNKSFSQAANLTAHVRTHSGEKPFRCPICDRRFSQSSSVTTHMRTHSGERPYRCRMCKKAFSDSSTLTKHLRIHSGEKPYQCKLCLLRFSQSGNLNRHMRVHSQNS